MCTICGGPVMLARVQLSDIVFWALVIGVATSNFTLGCVAGYVVAAYLSRDMY